MKNGINVSIDLRGLQEHMLAAVDKAVERLAIQTGKNWAMAIMAAKLPDAEKLEYAKTLRIDRAGLAHFVVSADYAKADQIENGRQAQDLKKMLQTSRKVRTSKAGKKYLIIPFRQNTAGNTAHARAMPAEINRIASQMETARVRGSYIDHGGVKRATYLWPRSRLSNDGQGIQAGKQRYLALGRMPAGLAPKLAPHHVSDPFAGMVRFDTSTGQARSSAYLTFRCMHQDSTGWIIPAKPGLHIARAVAENMERKAGPYIQALVNSMLK